MKIHTKIYLEWAKSQSIEPHEIECEICGKMAVDIHHLIFKQMGGSKLLDYIENLIAVCRDCHNKCHDHPEFNNKAKEIHLKNL
jgi:5-methylcytosine-specific restriction endonuclease McrA